MKTSNIKNPKTFTILFLLFISLLSFGCTKENENEIKIGAILPLTGEVSVYGQKMKKGIDLAVKQVNSAGGINGKLINITYEDDQGDPKLSVSSITKLISTDHIKVIIGGAISATALPAVPIADKNKVVLFSPAATSPKLSGISPYFFRNWPSDIYDGKAMGEFAATNLKFKRIAILYVNNEWGNAISNIFSNTFISGGGEITIKESYEQNSSDFRTQLAKIMKTRPEAIYIPGYLRELINILKQKEELGIKSTTLSAYGFYDPQILSSSRNAAEGAIFTAPFYDSENPLPKVKDYVTNFQKDYGEKPDIWSAQSYDAINIIIAALNKSSKSGLEPRVELSKTRNYDGVAGETSFDEKGDVQKPLRIMCVKGNKFINY